MPHLRQLPNDSTSKSSIEGIIDKDWSLDHHHEVTDRKIDHKDIRWSLQGLGAGEHPDNQSIAKQGHESEGDINESEQVVH